MMQMVLNRADSIDSVFSFILCAFDVSSTVGAPETAIMTYCHSTARCTRLHLLSNTIVIKALHAWLEASSPDLKSHMANNDG